VKANKKSYLLNFKIIIMLLIFVLLNFGCSDALKTEKYYILTNRVFGRFVKIQRHLNHGQEAQLCHPTLKVKGWRHFNLANG